MREYKLIIIGTGPVGRAMVNALKSRAIARDPLPVS